MSVTEGPVRRRATAAMVMAAICLLPLAGLKAVSLGLVATRDIRQLVVPWMGGPATSVAGLMLVGLMATCVPLALGAPLARTSWPARWWAGFLAAGTLLVGLYAAGVGRGLSVSIGAVAAAGVAAAWVRRDGWPVARSRVEPGHVLLGAVMAGLLVAAMAHTLAGPTMAWDAVAVWLPKVRGLASGASLAELARPTYPPLGAMVWSVAASVGGSEAAGRGVLAAAALVALLGLTDLVPGRLTLAISVLVSAVAVVFFGLDAFTNGYQDALLAAAAGMSAVALIVSFDQATDAVSRCRHAARGLAAAGALGLIKSEGAVFGACLMLAYLLVSLAWTARGDWLGLLRALRLPLAGYAGVGLLWPVALLVHGFPVFERQEGTFSAAGLLAVPWRLADRLPTIASAMAALLGDGRRLTLLAAVALAASAAVPGLWRHGAPRAHRAVQFLGVVSLFHLLSVIVMFLATEAPLAWHLDTALLRLLLHLRWIVAAIVVVVGVEVIRMAGGEASSRR